MNTDNTNRDAEPSPASAGSHEPVAWAVVYFDEVSTICGSRQDCERFIETQCRRDYMTAVPLYRNPDGEQEYGSLRAENERLRAAILLLADQDATLSVCGGSVTVTMDGTLTDAEQQAIADAIDVFAESAIHIDNEADSRRAETLRGLLRRLV
jgi:hypothetical protein